MYIIVSRNISSTPGISPNPPLFQQCYPINVYVCQSHIPVLNTAQLYRVWARSFCCALFMAACAPASHASLERILSARHLHTFAAFASLLRKPPELIIVPRLLQELYRNIELGAGVRPLVRLSIVKLNIGHNFFTFFLHFSET